MFKDKRLKRRYKIILSILFSCILIFSILILSLIIVVLLGYPPQLNIEFLALIVFFGGFNVFTIFGHIILFENSRFKKW